MDSPADHPSASGLAPPRTPGIPARGHAYPYPDFLQVVLAGCASERDDSRDARWVDREGYEASAQLAPVENAAALLSGDRLSQLARPFLDAL